MTNTLALMHNTVGKIHRIKLRVKELEEELNAAHPDFLSTKIPSNQNLSMVFYLRDILKMSEDLQYVLDKFYTENHETNK
jgi:ubiquinone biosynthesis protein Coq4